jgi:hypothetical protein
LAAPPEPATPTLAILGFQASRDFTPADAAALNDLLFVRFGECSGVVLVERAEMARIEDEHDLWALARPDLAATVGRELGAELILLGRLLPREAQCSYVAQFVSCQTGKQVGVTVRLPREAPLSQAADRLYTALSAALPESLPRLLPSVPPLAERAAEISAGLRPEARAAVWIHLALMPDSGLDYSPRQRLQEWLAAGGFAEASAATTAAAVLTLELTATAETALGEKVAVRAEARGDVTLRSPGSTTPVHERVLRVGPTYQATGRRALEALVDQVMPLVLRCLVAAVQTTPTAPREPSRPGLGPAAAGE